MSRSFRYGTSLAPSFVRGIIDTLPSHLNLAEGAKLMEFHPEERFLVKNAVRGKYPSVSALMAATDDLSKLFNWQHKMMQQMGTGPFKIHMNERMRSGTDFHKTVERMLEVIQKNGDIDESECDRIIASAKFKQNAGYCKGIVPVLLGIKKTPWMAMEKKTTNHYLCYQGKFDAIIELDGELTLVDWKTVSAGSVKSSSGEGQTLDGLYSNPLQVVAYINAVNTDPAFQGMPKIKRGAVVLAFEDGRPAEVVTLGEDDILQYTDLLLERVSTFWRKMMSAGQGDVMVNFVYNPRMMEPKKVPEVIQLDTESEPSDDDVKFIGTVTAAAGGSKQ